jgi:hypothetical protein
VAAEGKIAIGISNVRAENLNHVHDSEPAIPVHDYLKINPTGLHKFNWDEQVTLLAHKQSQTPPRPKRPKKGRKSQRIKLQ